MKIFRPQRGFTLVELLVVIAIISVLSGMVMTAVQGVTQTAKSARTRAIIAAVDSVIQEQYESYKYRPVAVEIAPPGLSASGIGYELLATEAARARLMMIRDLQRMELPDRFTDFLDPPTVINVVANEIQEISGVYQRVDTPADRRPTVAVWNASAKVAAFQSRYVAAGGAGTVTLEYEGAECLYLIMATAFVGGTPAIASIPESNIGDRDNDGMLEVHDGWGEPLAFIRWPVGYSDPEQSIDYSAPDDFDLLRSDFAYSTGGTQTSLGVGGIPWSTRPLIFSSGVDRERGIVSNPNAPAAFHYVTEWQTWAAGDCGSEAGGRTTVPAFPDPYLRNFVGTLPGGETATGALKHVDNITNYSLQAAQ